MGFTADFVTASNSTNRIPRARAAITWASREIDPDLNVTAPDSNKGSQLGQVADGVTDMSKKWAYANPKTLADGTFYPMPTKESEGQIGWYGHGLQSYADGTFVVTPYLTVTFGARAVSEVTVSGDSTRNEYPIDFDIVVGTDSLGSTTVQVRGNTQVSTSVGLNLPDNYYGKVSSIRLSIIKWSAGLDIVKIAEFYGPLREVYKGPDIIDMSILEETNSDGGTIPIGNISCNELDISLMNINNKFTYGNPSSAYSELLRTNRKIEAWLGFVLPAGSTDATGDEDGYLVEEEVISGLSGVHKVGYVPQGVFYSRDWKSSRTSVKTTTSAFDVLNWLRNTTYSESLVYTDTAYNIANIVMGAAKDAIPFLKWEVDVALQGVALSKAWFGVMNFFEAIRLLSEATTSYSFVNNAGVVIIGSQLATNAPTPGDPSYTLDESRYFTYDSQPKTDELINQINVPFVEIQEGTQAEDIYSSDEQFTIPPGANSATIFLKWSKTPVDSTTAVVSFIPSTGSPTLQKVDYYANGAWVTVGGTAGNSFSFTATGKVYQEINSSVTAVEDADSIEKYGLRSYTLDENTLVQSYAHAVAIAKGLKETFGDLRRDASATWSGNGIATLGDTMEVTEFKDDSNDIKGYFLIKRQNIKFDGSLRVSTELRRGI